MLSNVNHIGPALYVSCEYSGRALDEKEREERRGIV